MTKVKVQDATKQLSTNAGMLFETVSRARKQAQDTYGALKKISDDLNRTEKQRLEMEAKEALRKQYEAAATYMTGYSTEQVSEIQEAASRAEKERARAAEEVEADRQYKSLSRTRRGVFRSGIFSDRR